MNPDYAIVLITLRYKDAYYCTKYFKDMKHSTTIHNLKILGLIKSKHCKCHLTKLGRQYTNYLIPYKRHMNNARLQTPSIVGNYLDYGLPLDCLSMGALVPPIHLIDSIAFLVVGVIAPIIITIITLMPATDRTESGIDKYNRHYCREIIKRHPNFTNKGLLIFLIRHQSDYNRDTYDESQDIIKHQMFSMDKSAY